MAYRLTKRARADVLNLWCRIAEDSEQAADRLVISVTHHFRLLGEMPHVGRQRDEIRPGYRSFPTGEYLILYRAAMPGAQIMHVVHGRMDFQSYPFD